MISRNIFQFFVFPHSVSALFLYGKIVGEHKRIFVLLRVIKLSHSFSVPKPSSQITPFLQSCCFEAEFLLNHLGSFANSYFFLFKTALYFNRLIKKWYGCKAKWLKSNKRFSILIEIIQNQVWQNDIVLALAIQTAFFQICKLDLIWDGYQTSGFVKLNPYQVQISVYLAQRRIWAWIWWIRFFRNGYRKPFLFLFFL